MTDFAFRGSEPGPISIARKIDGDFFQFSSNNGRCFIVTFCRERKGNMFLWDFFEVGVRCGNAE